MGVFQATAKDIRNTVSSAMQALLDSEESCHKLVLSNYEGCKSINLRSWDEETKRSADQDIQEVTKRYHEIHKELTDKQLKINKALELPTLAEALRSIYEQGLIQTVTDGLKSLQRKIDARRLVNQRVHLNEIDMQVVLDRYEKFRQSADDYTDVREWLCIVAVSKWLSGEAVFDEQIQNKFSKKLTSNAKNSQGFSVSAEMILNGIWKSCTGYKKVVDELPVIDTLQTITALSCLDSRTNANAVNEVKTAYEKYRTYPARWEKNGSLAAAATDMHGNKELYDFIRAITVHRYKEMKEVLRKAAMSNNDQRKYYNYVSENYRYSSDDIAHAETYAEGLMLENLYVIQETLYWLEGLDEPEKMSFTEAVVVDRASTIDKPEIARNILFAIREFIEKRKTGNQSKKSNRERLTGIAGESWGNAFKEFNEKIDTANAFDLNALDKWGPIIKKAGYSTRDNLFNQQASLRDLFEFAVDEKMSEIRSQSNLSVDYIKHNMENKAYGLEYDIAVDIYLALKVAHTWLIDLMQQKEGAFSVSIDEKVMQTAARDAEKIPVIDLSAEKEVYRIANKHKPRETWPDCIFDELFEIKKRTDETNLKVCQEFCGIAGINEQANALKKAWKDHNGSKNKKRTIEAQSRHD